MFMFKPTLNKAYLTLILLYAFLLSLLFWYLPPLTDTTSFGDIITEIFEILKHIFLSPIVVLIDVLYIPVQGYGELIRELRDSFILQILISYVVACIVAVLSANSWKQNRFWYPTFLKTILTVLFALIFFVAGFLFRQTDTGSQFSQILFPIHALSGNYLHGCPAAFNPQFFLMCSSPPDAHNYVVLSIISLANACISYALSCLIADFIKKMEGRKIIRA